MKRDRIKTRATTVPVYASDQQRAALGILAAQKHTTIASVVSEAIHDKWGKELQNIEDTLFLPTAVQVRTIENEDEQ